MLKKVIIISNFILLAYIISLIPLNNNNIITKRESFVSNGNIKQVSVMESNKKDLSIGKIRIPKIGLDRKLYDINSNKNNIEENVTILKGSIFPGKGNSIIFLAAHSGNGKNAYFDKVKLLEKGDFIYLTYNNMNYNYIVFNKEEVPKTGYISGVWDYSDQIIITTCSDKKNKQLIIYGILKKD